MLVSAMPASAHTLGSRTLRQGATGTDVFQLQADLSKAGFITRATGKFSAATASDLKRFQHMYELSETGAADAHTVKVLREVMKLDAKAVDTQTSGGSGLGIEMLSGVA